MYSDKECREAYYRELDEMDKKLNSGASMTSEERKTEIRPSVEDCPERSQYLAMPRAERRRLKQSIADSPTLRFARGMNSADIFALLNTADRLFTGALGHDVITFTFQGHRWEASADIGCLRVSAAGRVIATRPYDYQCKGKAEWASKDRAAKRRARYLSLYAGWGLQESQCQ